jgi:hypothetical protein
MRNRFQFYEVVLVSLDASDESLRGQEGTVLGMSYDEQSHRWGYAVSMETTGVVCDFDERQLTTTGKHRNRADFYPGDTLKVQVDPNTGRGSIME